MTRQDASSAGKLMQVLKTSGQPIPPDLEDLAQQHHGRNNRGSGRRYGSDAGRGRGGGSGRGRFSGYGNDYEERGGSRGGRGGGGGNYERGGRDGDSDRRSPYAKTDRSRSRSPRVNEFDY
jgi:hypothetical protein